MSFSKNLFLCAAVLGLASCGHKPLRSERPPPQADLRYEDLDRTLSFGFIHERDEYDFAIVKVKHKDLTCSFMAGFKNGKLESSFPLAQLRSLENVYFKNLSVAEKRRLVLRTISEFEREKRPCTKDIAHRKMTTEEKIVTAILMPFVLPVALLSAMSFGAEMTVHLAQDTLLNHRMNKVRLGMSHADISKLFSEPLKKNKLEKYEYYSVDGKAYRLALYFENERLNAFVRGYQTPTQHESVRQSGKLDF